MSAETDLELVRGLAGAALASLEASRGRIDDLNVYPGSRRRHGHQPHADRARGRRGPRPRPRPTDRPALAPRGRAGGAHGRARQLGRDPLPDRPGCRRRPRGVDERGRRRAHGARAARSLRRGVPSRAAAGRGDDALRHPRARGGGGAPSRRAGAARRAARRARAARGGGRRADARAARRPARGRRRRRRRRRARRAPPWPRRRGRRRASARGARPPPTARSVSTRSTSSPRAIRYCTVFVVEGDALDRDELESRLEQFGDSLARGRRRDRAQGARPHRRSRRGAFARYRCGNDRGHRDREHARAAGAARGSFVARSAAAGEVRRRGGRRGGREPASVRDARRAGRDDPHRRRRPDRQPLDCGARSLRSRSSRQTRRSSCRTTRTSGSPPSMRPSRRRGQSKSCRPTRSLPASQPLSPTTAPAQRPRTPRRWPRLPRPSPRER